VSALAGRGIRLVKVDSRPRAAAFEIRRSIARAINDQRIVLREHRGELPNTGFAIGARDGVCDAEGGYVTIGSRIGSY
jgi:hypothetical protein